jgi:hypothetical protein
MSHPFLRRLAVLIVLTSLACVVRAQPAVARNSIANPTIVNLYWDPSWDAHHPLMTMAMIDTFTRALVASTYFAGLAEYVGGVPQTVATFAGGFPAAGCPGHTFGFATIPSHDGPTAPTHITEIDLARLVKCQVEAGGQPSGPNVIFNVFIPAGTDERNRWFCAPKGYDAYHFHSGNQAQGDSQPFTAIFANPACLAPAGGLAGGFTRLTDNLTHELVEAITDPRVDRIGSIHGEVSDLCPSTTEAFLLAAGVVDDYFSNASGQCPMSFGFSDVTIPLITGVVFRVGRPSLKDLTMTITGTGFGLLPGTVVTLPATTNMPYFMFTDTTAASMWTAGNSLPLNDAVTLAYRTWTQDRIVIDGFGGAFGTAGNIALLNDAFAMTVCNPQSGRCGMPYTTSIPVPPSVTSVSPDRGPARGGTAVTIHGTGFTSTIDTLVLFGTERARNLAVISPEIITVDTPANIPGEPVGILVGNSNGTNTTSPRYTYCGPVITRLNPDIGPEAGGTIVTITGSCLTDVAQVQFNGLGATNMHVDTDTQITVTSPPSECLSPASGTTFVVAVNALEIDPLSSVWNLNHAVGSPDTPETKFMYTGQFPSSHCLAANGIFRNPCLQNPSTCLELIPQLTPVWMGPAAGMQFTFSDLEKYDWARASIGNVASQGLFPGIDATHFSPENVVTRAEYVEAMQQLVRAPAPLHPVSFTDMKAGTVELSAAQALANLLDVYRAPSGGVAFRPGEIMDRQTAAAGSVSLAVASGRLRLASAADEAKVLAEIPDSAGIDAALRLHVATAIMANFLYMPNGRLAPTAPLTRAQMAVLVDRLQSLSLK